MHPYIHASINHSIQSSIHPSSNLTQSFHSFVHPSIHPSIQRYQTTARKDGRHKKNNHIPECLTSDKKKLLPGMGDNKNNNHIPGLPDQFLFRHSRKKKSSRHASIHPSVHASIHPLTSDPEWATTKKKTTTFPDLLLTSDATLHQKKHSSI